MLANRAPAAAPTTTRGGRKISRSSVRCSSSNGHHLEAVAHARGLNAAHTSTTASLYEVAEATTAAAAPASALSSSQLAALAAGGLLLAGYGLKKLYDTPSRTYDGNVGDEYDAWTDEGILEYYWGEHIHLGYYTEEERAAGWWKADFKAAKLRFTQEMFKWSGAKAPKRILDVGCGFGGSSRWLAAQFPDAQVTGAFLFWRACMRANAARAQTVITFCECAPNTRQTHVLNTNKHPPPKTKNKKRHHAVAQAGRARDRARRRARLDQRRVSRHGRFSDDAARRHV